MDKPHKAHRASTSGGKAEKKKTKETSKGFNEKAFAPKSGRRAERQGRRNVERDQARLHVPLVNRSPDDAPPPVIVAIVGPPGVGKSTLLKSLVKRYTKQTLSEPKGPITVVSGKKRRLTFVECNNDMNSLIDIGKIADVVLLMIDGSFGFEMEQFEFLNILQSHGFPKVIGVLTHLDLIKKQSTLRVTKKTLKKRFWTEIYQGAKLFYLSGVLNGRYPDNEIQNLSRFISVLKFRPLIFRNSHPYVLVDRIQDLTPREEIRVSKGKCDRTVALYGYLHGTILRPHAKIHVPGVGDFSIKNVSKLADPCPLPDENSEKRRKLSEKRKLLVHAPMSDIGGIVYDKDSVWISVPGAFSKEDNGQPKGEGEEMVIRLQDVNSTLDDAVARSSIQLLRSSRNALLPGRPEEDDGSNESDDDMLDDSDEDDGGLTSDDDDLEGFDAYHTEEDDVDIDEIPSQNTGRKQARSNRRAIGSMDAVVSAGAEEFTEGSDDGELWEGELIGEQQHARSFPTLERRTSLRKDWMKAIYQLDTVPDGPGAVTANDPDDDFFQLKHQASNDDEFSDRTKEHPSQKDIHAEVDLDYYRAYFFLSREGAPAAGNDETAEHDSEKDFEDLESEDQHTKEVHEKPTDDRASLAAKKELLKQKFDEQYDDPETSGVDFYTEKKNEISKQLELNRAAFEGMDEESRALVEGHLPGAYIRVELANAPCELIEHFKPEYPLLLGGLLPAEERLGFVQVRIKRHRWFPKPLKTNDPLIISLGWRRFQTLPVYSLDDHSIRMRMLKYTPEHMHCYATFYGPAEVPNTGFCAFNTLSSAVAGFRISATGVVLDVDCSTKILKKLKLTGVPFEIHKNTAFIKEMFNSALEVAKFEGANIRTVSGLRGQIKKAVSKPEGAFRATFEDKILMSDIIFLRAWYAIQPRKYYNPVTSLLLQEKEEWAGMRLTGQIRRDEGLKTPLQVNSTYKPVEHSHRRFNPLRISKKLQSALPYASKLRAMKPQHRPTYLQKRAVVMDPEEKKASALIQSMRALRKEQTARRKGKKEQQRVKHRKAVQEQEEKTMEKRKEAKKAHLQSAGRKRQADTAEEGRNRKRPRANSS